MTKKVLILVDQIGKSSTTMAKFVGEHLGNGTEVVLADFTGLYFSISEKSIYVEINKIPITDFDLVYFRRVGKEFAIIAATLATCLKEKNIEFIDSSWAEIGPRGGKFASLVKLCVEKLPIIKSVYLRREKLNENIDRIIEELGLPLIAKETSTQRGMGVYKIDSKEDFAKLGHKNSSGVLSQFLFQEYKSVGREYRLLVVGNKVPVWGEKTLTIEGEFRHNTALGNRHDYLNIKDLPKDMEKIAVDAAKKLKLEIAGVDIADDRATGKYYLIEVNRGPGFTNDLNFSPEFSALVDYINEKISK